MGPCSPWPRASPGLRARYVVLTGTEERHAEARTCGRCLPSWGRSHHRSPPAARRSSSRCMGSREGRPRGGGPHVGARPHSCAVVPTMPIRTTGRSVKCCRRSSETSSPCRTRSRNGTVTSGAHPCTFPLTADVAHRKVELLHKCFPSQASRDWWDDEVFLGLARLRGMECRAPYSEAFTCTKSVLQPIAPARGACSRDRATRHPGRSPDYDRLRRSRPAGCTRFDRASTTET